MFKYKKKPFYIKNRYNKVGHTVLGILFPKNKFGLKLYYVMFTNSSQAPCQESLYETHSIP